MRPGRRLDNALAAASLLGLAALAWLALAEAPSFEGRAGFTAPLAWKLFFFHVPIALVSFLAFGIALAGSVQFLRTNRPEWDRWAHASVEVGVVFTALTLATGMLWGKAEWGTPWRWSDIKLVLVLVLFLVYVAYLALRREIADPHARARVSALYAIAGFAAVPLAWFAQRIWASFHPTVFGVDSTEAGIQTPAVLLLFVYALAVFTCLLAFFVRWRFRLLHIEDHVEELSVVREVPA